MLIMNLKEVLCQYEKVEILTKAPWDEKFAFG